MKEFWDYYKKSPTYRDQPLWNFLYLKNNINPYIDKLFKANFTGNTRMKRELKEYNESNSS